MALLATGSAQIRVRLLNLEGRPVNWEVKGLGSRTMFTGTSPSVNMDYHGNGKCSHRHLHEHWLPCEVCLGLSRILLYVTKVSQKCAANLCWTLSLSPKTLAGPCHWRRIFCRALSLSPKTLARPCLSRRRPRQGPVSLALDLGRALSCHFNDNI